MVTKEQTRRMETAGMHFFRSVAGYGMADHKRNEDIREELLIMFVNAIQELYKIVKYLSIQ
jgi:hypothetical protein